MNLLLDTHILIWWSTNSSQLPPRIRAAIEDADNRIYVSIVSAWETVIKNQSTRTPISGPADELFGTGLTEDRMTVLPLTLPHITTLETLPLFHKDPFDRMLIAQCIFEKFYIATVDPIFAQYPCKLLS